MDLFEALVDEHRVIARVVDALDRFTGRLERGAPIDALEVARFVCFFREYAELLHHDKEEHLLFPAMGKKGYSNAGAPIAHIRDEHRRERQLILALQQLVVLKAPATRRETIIALLRQLVEFERAHMEKENELLYPAVKQELSKTSSIELAERLSIRELADRWVGDTTWLRDLADELHDTYARLE